MKKTLCTILVIQLFTLSGLAQNNPLRKSISIYLDEIYKQSKIDTLYIMYENEEISKYLLGKVKNTVISRVNSSIKNHVFLKIDMIDIGKSRRFIFIEQFSKINTKTNELDIINTGSLYFEFRYMGNKWRFFKHS